MKCLIPFLCIAGCATPAPEPEPISPGNSIIVEESESQRTEIINGIAHKKIVKQTLIVVEETAILMPVPEPQPAIPDAAEPENPAEENPPGI